MNMNKFLEHFVTMVTQTPVIVNEPFTQQLTIPRSPEFEEVQNRLVALVHLVDGSITRLDGSDKRVDLFVQRVRTMNCATNCTMNLPVDGKNPKTIPGILLEYFRY